MGNPGCLGRRTSSTRPQRGNPNDAAAAAEPAPYGRRMAPPRAEPASDQPWRGLAAGASDVPLERRQQQQEQQQPEQWGAAREPTGGGGYGVPGSYNRMRRH